MNLTKSKQHVILSCCGLLLLTSTFWSIAYPQPLVAQGFDLLGRIQRFFFSPRPQGVASGRQRGGAKRDRCPNVTNPLMAIVPIDHQGKSFVEKTIADRPVFWFYMPYASTARRTAEFAIIDEQEEEHYLGTFPLDRQPGIISLQLPSTLPPLKNGKKYQWVFSVICNPINRSGDATVNGSIEKVPVSESLNVKLKAATSKDLITIYTESGLWNDTLTALANFGKENPENKDFHSSWTALQKQLGLKNFSSQTWITYTLPEMLRSNNNSIPPQLLQKKLPVQTIIDNLRNIDVTPSPKPK
jgi:hypothetical protein